MGRTKQKKNKKSSVLLTVLIIIFLAIGIFSAVKIVKIVAEYKRGSNAYDGLGSYIQVSEPTEKPEPTNNPAQESTDKEDAPPEPTEPPVDWPVVDFEGLLEINSDCVGWIMIEDTAVNYPIVQSEDNSYYLNRLFDGTWNIVGSIFLDYRVSADFSYRNSPIYGHRMNDGSMFADLLHYREQEYYDLHPTGYLLTPGKNYQIEFFAGVLEPMDGSAWDYEFDSDEEFEGWIQSAKEKSCFESDVNPEVTDKIVTLSTCTRESGYVRLVLYGRLK